MKIDSPSEKLTVLGKFKGEIDSRFTMVYLAIDTVGQHWTNPSPNMNALSNFSDQGWTKISDKQLQFYRRELFFISKPNGTTENKMDSNKKPHNKHKH